MFENLIPLEPSCLSTTCTNLNELIEYGTEAQCRAALDDIAQQRGDLDADVKALTDDLTIEVSRADTFQSLADTMVELLREMVDVDGPDTATSKAIAEVLAKYDAE